MARAPTERPNDTGRTDTESGTEFLVVNTADAAREVTISLAREGGQTERLTLEAGGHASVATPAGEVPLAMVVETADDRAVGMGFSHPPMVVVDDGSVDLC